MNQSTRLGSTLVEGMKTPVVVATTLNIALQGLPLISGVQLVARDRVLVKSQNNKSENGIYVVASGTWDRAKDFNASNDVVNGQLVIDSNSGLLYRVDFTGEIDLGVTLISFFVADPDSRSKQVDTLADWQNDNTAQLDDVVTTAERSTGNGGGGTGDVIASGTETGFKIVKHNTLPLSWELRISNSMSFRQFGADPTNTLDSTGANNAAIASMISIGGGELMGYGATFLVNGTMNLGSDLTIKGATFNLQNVSANTIFVSSSSNVEFNDCKFIGSTPGVIKIFNNSTNIRIIDCTFDSPDLNQIIWLFGCNNIIVRGNTFRDCGYAVINQFGESANNVKITDNYSVNQKNDFVEANSGTALARNWLIANNIYDGGKDFPTPATERRFVGITSVRNVIVSNNIVLDCPGDGIVHLESNEGECVVSGNVFENWVGQDCVYILNNAKDTIVTSNIFIRSDTASVGRQVCISDSSGNFPDMRTLVDGNFFEDSTGENLLIAMQFTSVSANKIVSNNLARGLETFLLHNGLTDSAITGNNISECNRGIALSLTATSNGGLDNLVTGNRIELNGTTTEAIFSRTNTNGTNGPKRWNVYGNYVINGDIFLKEVSGGGGQTENNVVHGNTVNNGVVDVSSKVTPDADGNYVY